MTTAVTVESTAPASGQVLGLVEQALCGSPEDWDAALFSCLAQSAENALVGSKADLTELSRQLHAGLRNAWAACSAQTRAAVVGDGDNAELHAAYRLGQLSFAQLLVDQTLARRADDDFEEVLKSERYLACVTRLLQDELTADELAAHLSLPEPEVRLRMRELIHKGAADFRRCKGVRYFLTPAAKAVMAD